MTYLLEEVCTEVAWLNQQHLDTQVCGLQFECFIRRLDGELGSAVVADVREDGDTDEGGDSGDEARFATTEVWQEGVSDCKGTPVVSVELVLGL